MFSPNDCRLTFYMEKTYKSENNFFPDNANSMQKTPKEERHNLIQTKIQKIKRYVKNV